MFRLMMKALLCCAVLSLASFSLAQPLPGPPAPRRSAPSHPAISILSIIPAEGEPGMTVTVNGTGFTAATIAFLGTRELPTAVATGGKVLSFQLPELPAGAYALYLKREDGTTSRAFNFTLLPVKPVAANLTPDTIAACASGMEREVVLSGTNFTPGCRVLFDGAAIGTRFVSPSALSFLVPALPGGLHQVQVRNPSGASSGTLGLFIDSKPEIFSVAIGRDFVVYYELIITGRNFFQGSTLVADGSRITTAQPPVGDRDQVLFAGCNQLIYQRHPYDSALKEIRLQVVNPSGEESGIFTISAP